MNKRKVFAKLKDEKQVLCNYVTNILLDRVLTKRIIPIDKTVNLVVSKRETNKFLNENFKAYICNQIADNHKVRLNIEIRTIHQDKCLQLVDFPCWAIFRKHEHKDESYYNIIKKRIVEENPLFP